MLEIPINKLQATIEKIVNDLGYQLYDIEQDAMGANNVLRVLVQRIDNDGVDLDDCVKITHGLTPVLDNDPNLTSEYMLEVASPGIIRNLRTDEHLQQVVGETIFVKTTKLIPQFPSKEITDKLVDFSEDVIVVSSGEIPRNLIKHMETTFEF